MENNENKSKMESAKELNISPDTLKEKQIKEASNESESYELIDTALKILNHIFEVHLNPESFMKFYRMKIEPDYKGKYVLTVSDIDYLLRNQNWKYTAEDIEYALSKLMRFAFIYKRFTLIDKEKMIYKESYNWLVSTMEL